MLNYAIKLVEKGLIPDGLVRMGIRQVIRKRLEDEKVVDFEFTQDNVNRWIEMLRKSPIAIRTESANEQHYEVPAKFFELVLGDYLKYSCSYFPQGVEDLDEAEKKMLDLTCQRAQIQNGHSILELGCGWGSLTLWIAEKYPGSMITAVSNSNSQREFILERAKNKNLSNVEVITSDMNDFVIDRQFDRVVSIEMLEHMRNYERLFEKISSWLKKDGKFFTHVFSHKQLSYPYEAEGDDDWMAQHFFTGGQMPSHHLFLYFQKHIVLDNHWVVSGQHYQKTSEAWLKKMDRNRDQIIDLFKETYGKDYLIWFHRWRVFFMACAELFGFTRGQEWIVSHFLFSKR